MILVLLPFALLLSRCPVLEELIVNCIKWQRWSSASVASPTLKRLTIDVNVNPNNVQNLHLTSFYSFFPILCKAVPIFNNLNHLFIEGDDERAWMASLASLAQQLPHSTNFYTKCKESLYLVKF